MRNYLKNYWGYNMILFLVFIIINILYPYPDRPLVIFLLPWVFGILGRIGLKEVEREEAKKDPNTVIDKIKKYGFTELEKADESLKKIVNLH